MHSVELAWLRLSLPFWLTSYDSLPSGFLSLSLALSLSYLLFSLILSHSLLDLVFPFALA